MRLGLADVGVSSDEGFSKLSSLDENDDEDGDDDDTGSQISLSMTGYL